MFRINQGLFYVYSKNNKLIFHITRVIKQTLKKLKNSIKGSKMHF